MTGLSSGGIDVSTTLSAGALAAVESGALGGGAVASGTGAELLVLAGGTISGTILSAGGFDVVSGAAVSTKINSGGIEDDLGFTSVTAINGGGPTRGVIG